ncbi:S1C family serine protease [Dictyobacter aurantiacus]|nr:trypsin-like peptidase domain-containing protein [Dictyobacter aurantiacus]
MSHSDQKPDPSESSNIPQRATDSSSEQPAEQSRSRSYTPPFLNDPSRGGPTQPPPYRGPTEQPAGYAPLEAESDIYRSNETQGQTPTSRPSPYAEPTYRSYYPPDWPPTPAAGAGTPPGNVPSGMPPPYTPAAPPPGQYAYQAQGTAPQGFPPPGGAPGQRRGTNNKMQFIALPLIALLMGALGGWLAAGAATHSANALFPGANQSTEQVAAKFRTSVVQINVETQTGGGLGSGVIIDPRGYIVTNNHVVNNGLNYQVVLYDNTRLPANVVGTDPNDDLAVVKINPPKHLSVANIGDSSRLQVGQPVLAIGNPLGITQTVTGGIVSALGRNINEGQNNLIINAIQTDAAINPGNSGGALVNMQGNLIGIPTLVPIDPEFKTPASGVGFAIPSNRVKFIVPQLINSGRVVQSGRADIGVNVVSVDPDIADQAQLPVDHGALIVNVKPDSAAATAGLKRGDIIVEANNQSIQDTAMLQDFLINKSPGQTITLQIYRGNQQMPVKVQLGEQQFG